MQRNGTTCTYHRCVFAMPQSFGYLFPIRRQSPPYASRNASASSPVHIPWSSRAYGISLTNPFRKSDGHLFHKWTSASAPGRFLSDRFHLLWFGCLRIDNDNKIFSGKTKVSLHWSFQHLIRRTIASVDVMLPDSFSESSESGVFKSIPRWEIGHIVFQQVTEEFIISYP